MILKNIAKCADILPLKKNWLQNISVWVAYIFIVTACKRFKNKTKYIDIKLQNNASAAIRPFEVRILAKAGVVGNLSCQGLKQLIIEMFNMRLGNISP